MSKRIAITGISGLIGTRLSEDFQAAGQMVRGLQRGVTWAPLTGEIDVADGIDVLMHLAGRTVGTRWTAKARREIWDSRVPATEKLCGFLARMPAERRPKLLLAASAVGIYGDRGEEALTEESAPMEEKRSFLADVCRAWEAATKPAEEVGIQTVHLRFGMVLSPLGGALKKMLTPTKLGLGGPIGSGRQFVPWISLTDASRLILQIIETPEFAGPLNVVTPNPVRQHELARTIATAVHRPAVFPLPGFMVKLAFGQMGREALLGSQRVMSMRVPSDFEFRYPTIREAVEGELASTKRKA